MRKKEYFCPTCKKFVNEWYVDPLVFNRGRVFTGSGPVVKICKKCNSALMEIVKEEKKK